MKLKLFLYAYDNWNANVIVEDVGLLQIIEGKVVDIVDNLDELHQKEIISFGIHNKTLTVKVR